MYLTGFKFWKVGSRKVYAIPEGDLRPKRAQRQIVISESESEDDFQQPVRKRFASTPSEGMPLPSKILSEVKHIRNDLKGLFQISAYMKIPPGLYRHLNDTFQCHICRSSPITPPVIFSRCCKRLLGCQTCVDSWYRGEEGMARSCPLCRSERAYAETTPLKGLDDFLRAIVPLLACNDNTRPSDQLPSDGDDGMPTITLQ